MTKQELDKFEICKRTRKIAADSLYNVLKRLLQTKKSISEVVLSDAWLAEFSLKRIDQKNY